MVEALGYRIRRLFLGVFMAGSGLAGLGGVMWALYREQVHASMGNDLTVLVFIVVIIGGLGSIGGCFIGALLVRHGGQLRRLPGAEAGAGFQHPADGRDPDVAPARALCGDEVDDDPFRRSAAQPRALGSAPRHHRGAGARRRCSFPAPRR